MVIISITKNPYNIPPIMDSIALNFSDFKDYKRKLNYYLNQANLLKSFEECRINGIKKMIDELNLNCYDDVDQLAYLLWSLQSECEQILDEYLLTKINLDVFAEKIKQKLPQVDITGFAGATPLGGFRASFQGALAHYNCIKFIGQFTKSQEVYNKCLEILGSMPEKVDGPILNPPDIVYLMKFNKNISVSSNNKIYPKILYHLDNHYDFYHSIYQPDPSHEHEYNRYKIDIQKAYYDISQNGDYLGYLCLIDRIINSHWNVAQSMDSFTHPYRMKVKLSDGAYEIIEKLLVKISEQVLPDIELESKLLVDKVNDIVNEHLRFIISEEEGKGDIRSIFIEAFVYITDNEYDKCEKKDTLLKKRLLIELYERKIVDPDGKLSHNLMRDAVENGVLWIVKLLVEKGCRTRDLPAYGSWPWSQESLQLTDILKDDMKNYCSYPQEYMDKKNSARNKVCEYLLNNYLIDKISKID